MTEQRVTISEAAALTGKSADAIRRAIKHRKEPLPAIMEGGEWRISLAALSARYRLTPGESTSATLEASLNDLEARLTATEAALEEARQTIAREREVSDTMRQALQAQTMSLASANARLQALETGSKPARRWWNRRAIEP
jgi:uncharacterized coiled-coil protein SlyX